MPHPHQQSVTPTLSAIICCYTSDRATLLTRAITATRAQLLDVDELLVVVDHNDDLLISLTAQFPTDHSAVTVVASSGPRGLSGARNTGARVARGDVLVFIDDDAEPVPGSFAAVRSRFADDDISALGGAIDARWLAPRPTWFPEEFGWVVGCDYRGLPGHSAQIRNPIGAAMAVRRDRLEAVGGFSTALGRRANLPAGCEETLMGIALRQRFPDSTILRDTHFRVLHAVSPDRARFAYFARRCYEEGRSKATLSRLTSTDTALSTERGYATRTLPQGVWRSRHTPTRVAALTAEARSVRTAILAGAQRFTDRPAIRMAGQSLTYGQLVDRATSAAASITAHASGASNPIVVQVGLSPDAVALVLGVFLSGHPIVALDPHLPAERVSTILAELEKHDRRAEFMIADAEHLDAARAVAAAHELPVTDLAAITQRGAAAGPGTTAGLDNPDSLTSIQFTSGSTGTPKGVLHPNGMWLCDSELMRTGFSITPGRRVALCLPISFGAGLNVLIGSLINGADITAVDPRDRTAAAVLDELAECAADVTFLTPALLRALTSAREATGHPAWTSLRRIITTGEALTSDVAQAALSHAPEATVTNWVGSSETSALAYFDLRAGEHVSPGPLPAGVLAPHKSVTIDDDGRVVVSSRHLALGYLDPAADEDRFSRDADGVLSFRTGDRGTWDGATLILTGRVDDAVKIRGYLVEPAEVHRAIMSDGDLAEAAVIARKEPDSGRTELLAYVAPVPGGRTPPAAEIRTRLRQRLPEWMIPAHVVELAALPRTARGKIDRAALPAPTRHIDPPVGDLEMSVAAIWSEALGLDEIGRDENIYALGADSLTVAQILVGITRRHGVALTQADAASAPTVAAMARTLDARLRPDSVASSSDSLSPTTVPLRRGDGQTVFCFAGAGASALVFVALADHLAGDERIGSIYGFQPHGLENRGFPDWTVGMAARRHLRDLRRLQPSGPYVLLGHSLGGLIALEVARRLRHAGEQVELVMTLDTFVPQHTARAVGSSAQTPATTETTEGPQLSRSELWRNRIQLLRAGFLTDEPVESARAMEQVGWRVGRFHRPAPYHGRVLVVLGADNHHDERVWTDHLTPGDITITRIRADHMSIVREPHITEVVGHFLHALP